MNRVKEYIGRHIVSWVIEIAILGIIATVTIAETVKTARQTRAVLAQTQVMLKSISEFSSMQAETVGSTITNVSQKVKAVDLEDDFKSIKRKFSWGGDTTTTEPSADENDEGRDGNGND